MEVFLLNAALESIPDDMATDPASMTVPSFNSAHHLAPTG